MTNSVEAIEATYTVFDTLEKKPPMVKDIAWLVAEIRRLNPEVESLEVENERLRKAVKLEQEEVHGRRLLCLAYRMNDHRGADKALTILEGVEKKRLAGTRGGVTNDH